MKTVRTTVLGLFLVSLGLIGWAQGGPGAQGRLPGDHYRWLLDSPVRPYLSGAAEQFLWLKYGSSSSELSERPGRIKGLEQRVNDRAQDENPSRTTQSETAIAVFGSKVVIGWNDVGQFTTTGSLTGYGYSGDGGRRFADGGVIPPVTKGANLGDPDIAVDSAGNFYFSQISLDKKGIAFIGVAKSTDGGRSWSVPVNASPGVSGPDSFQDKEFIVADNTGGRYDGNVYVSWTRFSRQGGRITFARSTDGGRHFQKPITLSPPGRFVQGSMPRVGQGGEVYVAWQEFNHPGIRISKSTDGGRSFAADGVQNTLVAPIEFIGQQAPPATCQGRSILNGFIDAAFEFPALGVNPTDGEIYVVFNSNPPGPDQSDIYFVRSSDGGRSFSTPIRLNDDYTQSDQFMPALAVAPNGAIGAIWYDRRADPQNLKLDVYMAVSSDGGRSWSANRRVTTVSFDVPPLGPNFDSVRPCYMGDYIDITADEQQFYLTWGDNRDRGLTWKSLPDMPTPRERTANAALGNTLFAIGGAKLGFRQAGSSSANQAYNTRSRLWTELAPMPTARADAAAVARGLSIYVLGGQASQLGGVSAALERYDLLSDRWTRLAPMPTARTDLGAALIGDKIYAIGGQDCISLFCGHTLDTVEVYDIRTDRWTEAAPLPAPRADLTATVALGGKIYLFGGFDPRKRRPVKDVNVYDPNADRWSQAKPMRLRRSGSSAGICGSKIVLFGGYTTGFTQIRRHAMLYDPQSESWRQVAAPKLARQGIQAVASEGVLYALGGSSESRVAHSGANESFDCRRLGYDRPDPDVFFARRPVPLASTSAHGPERPGREAINGPNLHLAGIQLIRQRSGLTFQAQASGGQIQSIKVEVYGLNGEKLFEGGPVAGRQLRWDLRTGSVSRPLANGVYLYLVTVSGPDGQVIRDQVRKMVLLR